MKFTRSLAVAALATTLVAGCAGQTGTSPEPGASDVTIDPTVPLDTQMKDALSTGNDALSTGNDALVDALLEAGLDPDVDLGGEATPLHRAAVADQVPIVESLLEAGADVDSQADNGQTPLMVAASLGSGETVDALLDGGADPLISNPKLEGMTALHYAAWQGRPTSSSSAGATSTTETTTG